MPEFHALARCCWCGGRFRRARFYKARVWVCERGECQQRQADKAILTGDGKGKRCLYLPLPKQVEFEDAVARTKRVLLGGAAGGSKSHALRYYLHRRAISVPGYRGLLLRKNLVELERTHIYHAQLELPLFGGTMNLGKYYASYPQDSRVDFGHLADIDQVTKHLSTEYDDIAFDEITTFPETEARLIMSRARTTKDLEPRIVAGTNPGGPSSHWVKRRWVTQDILPTEEPGYKPEDHEFVPSKLEDNPYLDASYEDMLVDLPEELRRAYRDGDWDIFPGQFFQEWRRDKHVRVMHPPYHGKLVIAVDWGYMAPGVCLFIEQTGDGPANVIREYVFQKTVASDVAQQIRKMGEELGMTSVWGVGDYEMWRPQTDSGESIAETFGRFGVYLTQADKIRTLGWQRLRHWLRDCEAGRPWLQINEECRYLIRTLPAMSMNERHPEDIADGLEDHAMDALRYWAMTRPSPEAVVQEPVIPVESMAWHLQRERQQQQVFRRMGQVR